MIAEALENTRSDASVDHRLLYPPDQTGGPTAFLVSTGNSLADIIMQGSPLLS